MILIHLILKMIVIYCTSDTFTCMSKRELVGCQLLKGTELQEFHLWFFNGAFHPITCIALYSHPHRGCQEIYKWYYSARRKEESKISLKNDVSLEK